MTKSNNKMKKRIVSMLILLFACFTLLIVRLGYIMLYQGDDLKKQALEQQTRDRLINSKRGTIYDRNGKPLAVSASVETVSISPVTVREEGNKEKTISTLSSVLEIEEKVVAEKIEKKSSYEIIMKKVEKQQADKIREAKLKGVYLDEDTKRYYPYGNFASHIIGFTGSDNQGLLGIEMVYDDILRGKPGRIVAAKNADGTEMPYKHDRYFNPENGTDIVLTLDQTLQHFLEKHLESAVVNNKLQQGAAGIIMDVKTGEILAMATKPDFNLNEPFEIPKEEKNRIETITEKEQRDKERNLVLQKSWRNKAVVDSYEPGSTFKIIVSAIGLETGALHLTDQFYCNGSKKVGPHTIKCWKQPGHGQQDFVAAIKNSCNPAFMDVGEKVGTERFYNFYKGFGFTQITGIELPGETSGLFYPLNSFNEVELATASFGQGPIVTPLQMITAVSAVANNGNLMRPHLVKQYVDENGTVTKTFEPQTVRQVISEETSKTLCQLLENVVVDGSGKSAFIKGYHIAGKTGTSEKIPRGNNKYISSFAGFAPANDPKIACLIILDEPTGGDYYGGIIAAPVVKDIMQDSLRYLGVEADLAPEDLVSEISVPNVIGKSVTEANDILNKAGLKCKIEGENKVVLDQVPKGNVTVAETATVILYTEEITTNKKVTVPKLIGMGYNDVVKTLSNLGLNLAPAEIVGAKENAKAKGQTPQAGTKVDAGSSIKVEFATGDLH